MRKYINLFNDQFFAPAYAGLRGLPWKHPLKTGKIIYKHFMSDSLYRNSIYLMASTFIMAFFGFFFWIINARLYTPEQVGIATTLISVMTLIASFSNLGLNVGLVRFLPGSDRKNELINSSFVLSSLTAFVLSVGFLAGLHVFSPSLLFVRENPIYAVSFILFVVALANNTIAESLFVAYRSAKYTLVKNSVLSIVKLALPVVLIAFGAYGIFTAVGLANLISFFVSILILLIIFAYKFKLTNIFNDIKKIGPYSFKNYLSNTIGSLSSLALPLFITNSIGPSETGYFYIVYMISSLIFVIPMSVTQSLFAEASTNEESIKLSIRKAYIIVMYLLVPVILLTFALGKLVLSFFGDAYAENAYSLLLILAVSSFFLSINGIAATILRLKNKIRIIIALGALTSVLILSLSYLFINLKLLGIGLSWIIGQAAISIVYLFILKKREYI